MLGTTRDSRAPKEGNQTAGSAETQERGSRRWDRIEEYRKPGRLPGAQPRLPTTLSPCSLTACQGPHRPEPAAGRGEGTCGGSFFWSVSWAERRGRGTDVEAEVSGDFWLLVAAASWPSALLGAAGWHPPGGAFISHFPRLEGVACPTEYWFPESEVPPGAACKSSVNRHLENGCGASVRPSCLGRCQLPADARG